MVFSKRVERALIGLGAAGLISGFGAFYHDYSKSAISQEVRRRDEIELRMRVIDNALNTKSTPREVVENLPYWSNLDRTLAELKEEYNRLAANEEVRGHMAKYRDQLTYAQLYGIIGTFIGIGGTWIGVDNYMTRKWKE